LTPAAGVSEAQGGDMYKQLQQRGAESPPVNVGTLREMKEAREPIACLTAYDASFAQLVDMAETDVVLVGDSLGMVVQGHDTTVPVTVADMIYHTRNVARGLRRAFLIADMPFMSYATPEQALDNAVRLMQEGGAMMVKLEGGRGQVGIVEYLASHDIPVCAHLGLKPQSVHKIGGFRVQGRNQDAAQRMLDDARALEAAGADVVLLECVPSELGAAVAAALRVPVIGIGAGPGVDGQILVLYDVLGITQGRMPRFVKNFQTGRNSVLDAVRAYVHAVKERAYPASEHEFHLAAAALTLDADAPLPNATASPAATQALPAHEREDDEPR
jgi:3-methyl-2-oxobutanoate hydroxymethyltransferase